MPHQRVARIQQLLRQVAVGEALDHRRKALINEAWLG
jgi:hypothetical protein